MRINQSIAVALAILCGAIAACNPTGSGTSPTPCPSARTGAENCPLEPPKVDQTTWVTDDFGCDGGTECGLRFKRKDCGECPLVTVGYRTKDITAMAGTHYVGVDAGTVVLKQGQTSGVITIKTRTVRTKVTFEVDLLIDGQVASKAVGTVNP